MSLWGQIRQRRVTQIVVTYLAAGWMALAVVDQVVDREVLPAVAYRVGLTIYLFGIGWALILGWFHGEKGHQKASALEIVLLAVVALGAVASSAQLVRSHLREGAVLSALETSTMDLRRIAVLYFEDESTGGSLGAVGDALTDGLIRSLNQVRELDMVSRNGSESVRGLDLPLDSVARIFGAGTLIEGSIDGTDDGDVRINVRLVDGQSGTLIQRDLYYWPSDSLPSVSGELAQEVSRSLRVLLGEELRLREGRASAPSTAAWLQVARGDKALRDGLAAWARGDQEAAERALTTADEELSRAQQADEEWVEPLVLRGKVAYERHALGGTWDDFEASLRSAIGFADQVLALEPDDAAALELRGTSRYRLWLSELDDDEDAQERLLAAAQDDLEQARNLDRTRANVNSVLSHLYYQVGDWQEAVLAARAAYQEDAFLAAADGVLRRLYLASYDLGQYEEARDWCLEGRRRFPDNFRFVQCQIYLLTMNGSEPDVAQAWELYDEFVSMLPEGQAELFAGITQMFVGGVIGRAGLADSADAVMVRARLDRDVDASGEQLSMEAAMRSMIGDVEGAVDALQSFMILNPGHFPGEHWWWHNLEGNPDFERLKTMN